MNIRVRIFLSLTITALTSVLLAWLFLEGLNDGAHFGVPLFVLSVGSLVLGISMSLGRSISAPIRKIGEAAQSVRKGDLDVKTGLAMHDEIGGLGRAFDEMIESLSVKTRALQESKDFYDKIMDCLPTMVFVKEAEDLRFILFNRAAGDLLGLDPATMKGKNDYDFWPQDEARFFVEKDRAALHEGTIVDIPEEPITSKKHGVRWLHTRKVPVYDEKTGKPRYLLGISEDITERKALIDKLAESNAELERFAYVAAHDLQEPLRMIASFSEILVRNYSTQMDATGKECLNYCIDGARRMQALIQDLLEYSRLGSDAERFDDVDCNNILRIVLENLGERISSTGAKVTSGELPRIKANPVRVIRLLQNLIGNGLKYQEPGNTPVVHVAAEDRGDEWLFSVKDNGIGIKKEYLKQIFEPFKRLHGKHEYPGTGIGLAITQKIVEGLGGRVWAESEEGQGCTFFFTVPKRIEEKEAA